MFVACTARAKFVQDDIYNIFDSQSHNPFEHYFNCGAKQGFFLPPTICLLVSS